MALELAHENIWFDKWRVDDAERQFYENKSLGGSGLGSLASQIAKARQEIQNSLVSAGRTGATGDGVSADVLNRITKIEGENSTLSKSVSYLEQRIIDLTKRLEALECGSSTTTAPAPATPKKSSEANDGENLLGADDDEE
ncbi:elongation factor 1-delta-like isoform X1 [Panulirus ornatus]|uniref:elongation factor 1-delta-like isoform X1 n=1 Tax=Panulirus ornatus TaxID=150431 RepID=UPI003A840560